MPLIESLFAFRRVVAAGYAELESRRQEVNDLNVFPVADGDTGDNMAMTLRAVIEELDGLDGTEISTTSAATRWSTPSTRAALLGARGNSRRDPLPDRPRRGRGARLAARRAGRPGARQRRAGARRRRRLRVGPRPGRGHDAVRGPRDGPPRRRATWPTWRSSGSSDFDPAEQDALLAEVLEGALEAGTEAVERRAPSSSPSCARRASSMPAAYGLTVIIAGVLGAPARRADAPELEHQAPPAAGTLHLPQHESSEYRYCTNFAVTGSGLVGDCASRPQLEAIGDCVLVVGDDETLRVHVHTDEPERAAALFDGAERGVALRRRRHARAGGRARARGLAATPPPQPEERLCRGGCGQRPATGWCAVRGPRRHAWSTAGPR